MDRAMTGRMIFRHGSTSWNLFDGKRYHEFDEKARLLDAVTAARRHTLYAHQTPHRMNSEPGPTWPMNDPTRSPCHDRAHITITHTHLVRVHPGCQRSRTLRGDPRGRGPRDGPPSPRGARHPLTQNRRPSHSYPSWNVVKLGSKRQLAGDAPGLTESCNWETARFDRICQLTKKPRRHVTTTVCNAGRNS